MTAVEDVSRVVRFVDERCPGFAKRITGADDEDIENLERSMGVRVPQAYRAFLGAMGFSKAELSLVGADYFAPMVGRTHAGGEGRYHRRFFFIGRGDEGEFPPSIYLDAGRPCGDDCAVTIVRGGPTPDPDEPAAYPSFLGFLTVQAFIQFAVKTRADSRVVGVACENGDSEARRLERLQRGFAAMGFERVLGEHLGFFCAERKDASVVAYDPLDSPGVVVMWLGVDDEREMGRILEIGSDAGLF